MALLGEIISRSLKIRKKLALKKDIDWNIQRKTLIKLLEKAQYTSFGKRYNFEKILSESVNFAESYRLNVPSFNYSTMYKEWWHRCMEGEENVAWPGKVNYFALSSGTSESTSKHIPVTRDMIKSIKKVGLKQFYSMTNFEIPSATFTKGILMLGGTTSLMEKEDYYEGDMSGISAKNIPRIVSNLLYKPGKKISKSPNWEDRIKLIVENAPKWDVGTLCGVPAWALIVLEEIIKTYKLKTIHDIWPNLAVYIHGGVAFEPYKEPLKKMMGKPMNYIETYMASEGSFGFQSRPGVQGIQLALNAGIFYEFVPFNEKNFTEDGEIRQNAETHFIHQVEKGVDYAVMLSTCAGAWRYIIGDVIRFTSVIDNEIIIVGRTKQFLSLCGEHTSVDNMNKAIDAVIQKLKLDIGEFTVAGFAYDNRFAHRWYLGCDDKNVKAEDVKNILDETLCAINDDYAVERKSALKDVFVEILPKDMFINYLKHMGKYGAMNKFPRVLKGTQMRDWEEFVKSNTPT